MKNKFEKNALKWSFWIGIAIVLITHIMMLFMGLSEQMIKGHAWINLIATFLIIIGVQKIK